MEVNDGEKGDKQGCDNEAPVRNKRSPLYLKRDPGGGGGEGGGEGEVEGGGEDGGEGGGEGGDEGGGGMTGNGGIRKLGNKAVEKKVSWKDLVLQEASSNSSSTASMLDQG